MDRGKRSLTVAAVQMASRNGDIAGNLARATPLVETAAARGASLVLLPEFMPTGYIFSREIWDAAEPGEGATVRWLRDTSRRLGIWLGTSYLEAEGEHFYNSFVLTDPRGEEAGRVRKRTPACAEAYFTRGQDGPHCMDTALGRIGVGICYENQLAYLPRMMCAQDPDILLMPHSAPSPMPNPFFPAGAVAGFNRLLEEMAPFYAAMLGVPAVFANKCGPWVSPMPGLPFLTQTSSFPGLSAIADGDGTVKARLGDEEGVIVAEVTLDPARKTGTCAAGHGRWAMRVPRATNLWRVIELAGGIYYRLSPGRRRRARAVSSGATA
ncbi:MAG: carbon-nitrogen hydrolase family protein [Actinomycetota bacterium]|nr:carbon-nitrogen hydrolase family protein [Actinomycetota bacterium]